MRRQRVRKWATLLLQKRIFGRSVMEDVIWILVTIAFFALSIGYVRFCDRMR